MKAARCARLGFALALVAGAAAAAARPGALARTRVGPTRARPVALFKFLEDALGPKAGPDETLKSCRLVPDVLAAPFEVKVDLEVRYPAWVRSSVDLNAVGPTAAPWSFGDTPSQGAGLLNQRGVRVKPTQVRDTPKVDWEPQAAGAAANDPLGPAPDEDVKHYTLALIDADAPRADDPSERAWLHWLVVNIPGNELEYGQTLRRYVGAFPPTSSGVHRYFFLLMEQRAGEQKFALAPGDGDELTTEDVSTRGGWSAAKFAAANGLSVVGWHHFTAEFDPYSIELMADLRALR
jgi:hypothetical protein